MSSPNFNTGYPLVYQSQTGTTWITTTVGNIDEDISSPDGLVIQSGNNAVGTITYTITFSKPSDYLYTLTAKYNIRYNLVNRSNDTESLYIQLWDNGGLAPLTDEMLVTTNPAAGLTNSGEISFTGIKYDGTLNSYGWTNPRVVLRTAHTASGGADNSYWEIDCINIGATYESTPTKTLDSPANGTTYYSNWPTSVDFHGHDTNSNDLEFEVQIDTSSDFNSQANILFDTYTGSLNTYTGLTDHTTERGGQSFTASATGILTHASIYLLREGSPVGTMVAKLYSHSGVYGTSSVGNTLLATSESRPMASFPGNWAEFKFRDGYELQSGTHYVIVVETTKTWSDADNYVAMWADSTTPTHDGNVVLWNGTSWSSDSGKDAIFIVSSIVPVIRAVSELGDAGFTAGHPYTDGESITYTFQQSLTAGTWYWSVAVKDVNGAGVWTPWLYRIFILVEGSGSPSASPSVSPSASISPSASPSVSPSASPSASMSSSPSASLSWPTGEICYGHITGVIEDTIKTFVGHWEGDGTIENSGDAERIALDETDYMFSEVINMGLSLIGLDYNHYSAGDTIVLKYRHGTTDANCQAAAWNTYSGPFSCLGYLQVRVEYL